MTQPTPAAPLPLTAASGAETANAPAAVPQSLMMRCLTWLSISGVFVAVSLLSVPVPGVNEPHYLSKARSFANPDWCARDFFLQSADAHAVFFAIVGPMAELQPFEVVLIGGRILSLLLLGWGWQRLAAELQLSRIAAVFAASFFCLIAMTGNFSGEWVVGGFESKVPAYGCALAGVAFWLKAWRTQRLVTYATAGGLCGLAVAWHPVVGLWFCIGMAFTEVGLLFTARPVSPNSLTRNLPAATSSPATQHNTATVLDTDGAPATAVFGREAVWWQSAAATLRQLLVFSGVALACALPGLIPALKLVLDSELPQELQQRANFIQVFWRLSHHLDPSTFPIRNWIHTGVLAAICASALIAVHVRHSGMHRSAGVTRAIIRRPPSSWRPMIGLLAVAAITTTFGIAIGWHSGPATQLDGWEWRAALLKFYPFRFFDALLPMFTALTLTWLLMTMLSVKAGRVALASVLLVTFTAAGLLRPHAASGYSAKTQKAWIQACHWLRTNTPSDSLIATPRESFGLKLFAERAEYVCFKDCPQDAAGILEWDRRLWLVHDWSKDAFQDGRFDNADLKAIHQQTGVTHLLTRRLGPFERDPVWQNEVWRIYETTGLQ